MRYDPQTLQRGLEFIAEHGLTDVHKFLVELVGPGKEVLEVGCASGYVSKAMTEKGCVVDGLEIDPILAEKARPICRKVIVGDLEKQEVRAQIGGPYDVLLMADVVEHLAYPEDAVKALIPYLKPDGRAIIAVPNIAHYSQRLNLLRGHFDYTDFGILDRTHLRFFTYDTLLGFVENCGLKPERIVVSEVKIPFQRVVRKLAPGLLNNQGWLARAFPNLFGAHLTIIAKPTH